MRHAIRALGWVTTVLWILVILFSGTVVYSAMQIGMNFGEEPQVTHSDGTMTLSIPFSIINGGFYDISQLNITTSLADENETVISRSTSFIEVIQKGTSVNEKHDISISLDDMLAKNLSYMLFNDTNLNIEMLIKLTYAHAIPLKISSNLTMPWGAPLNNLTIGEISITPNPPYRANVPLSFENHAFFGLNGTILLEIVNSSNHQVGSGTTDILIPPGGRYDDTISVAITGDAEDVAEARLYFETPIFSFGPVVIPIE